VGLVAGTAFADFGNVVTCVDKDITRVSLLDNGIIPIKEPQLEKLVARQLRAGRLCFTSRLEESVPTSDVIVLAVGTPALSDGSADLSALFEAVAGMAPHLQDYTVIMIKSTVPIGTVPQVRDYLAARVDDQVQFDIVSNPEFLRQGHAVEDFMSPKRIVVGSDSEKANKVVRGVYRPLLDSGVPLFCVSHETAELAKYASNTFLAIKISFANEMANLCDQLGADVREVTAIMGLDDRIGSKFLQPGPGFGGSCLPKDTAALLQTSRRLGHTFHLGEAVEAVNARQRKHVIDRIGTLAGGFEGKRITVFGLTFKAGTDDVRESPAVFIARGLISRGARVSAFDPAARLFGTDTIHDLRVADQPYDVCEGADLLVVLTEWPYFRDLDYRRIRDVMAHPVVFDTRNLLDAQDMKEFGFTYHGLGCNQPEPPAALSLEEPTDSRLGKSDLTADAAGPPDSDREDPRKWSMMGRQTRRRDDQD
jgi:UDPglucose 6-dehydrogenase